jgi:hypothetical protein
MFRMFRAAAAVAVGTLLYACSAQDSTSPAPLGIVGQWNQGARLTDPVNHQTHTHTGYFTFKMKGAGFEGTGQQSGLCTSAAHGDYVGPLANGVAYQIGDGLQSGDHVSFKSDLCTYEGTLSADGQHIDGTARCAYSEGGVDFVWTGDWLANRER